MNVKLIRRHGHSALVEWADADGMHRVTIPDAEVIDSAVDPGVLAAGIPYGVPWEDCPLPEVTPADVARELRNRGIWTRADLEAEPMKAISAVQAAYGNVRAALIQAALDYERRDTI